MYLGARHGAQSVGDAASKATLENEFGTANEDECMIKILENGSVQESEVGRATMRGANASTNEIGISESRTSRAKERLHGKSDSSLRKWFGTAPEVL